MYVYTEKAQKRAEEIGVEPRIAGQPAYFGHSPLHLHEPTALAWKEKGYVVWVDDTEK